MTWQLVLFFIFEAIVFFVYGYITCYNTIKEAIPDVKDRVDRYFDELY